MEKRILAYAKYLKTVQAEKMTSEERDLLCKKILVQIGFFQHERLIHLIVTVLFALMTVGVFGICALKPSIPFFGLELMLLVLLVPYIRHYFILENTVQQMYRYYDRICGESWEGSGPKESEDGWLTRSDRGK